MLIIGLGHKARQGKNTAARAMLNCFPLDVRVRQYSYADALRAEVKRAIQEAGSVSELIAPRTGLAAHMGVRIPAWVKAEDGKPRTLLQWWGSDYRRAQDPAYWVKRLQATLDREQPDAALITDVRFPNEADAIHAAGGVVIRVTRTTKPDVIVPEHISETALDGYTGWDYTIEAGTLPELRRKAEAIYKKIAVRK